MGLISTLVNVLSKPEKTFNPTALGRASSISIAVTKGLIHAIVTTCVTGGLSVLLSIMYFYYHNYLLAAVKADHRRAYGDQSAKDVLANNTGQQVV